MMILLRVLIVYVYISNSVIVYLWSLVGPYFLARHAGPCPIEGENPQFDNPARRTRGIAPTRSRPVARRAFRDVGQYFSKPDASLSRHSIAAYQVVWKEVFVIVYFFSMWSTLTERNFPISRIRASGSATRSSYRINR